MLNRAYKYIISLFSNAIVPFKYMTNDAHSLGVCFFFNLNSAVYHIIFELLETVKKTCSVEGLL